MHTANLKECLQSSSKDTAGFLVLVRSYRTYCGLCFLDRKDRFPTDVPKPITRRYNQLVMLLKLLPPLKLTVLPTEDGILSLYHGRGTNWLSTGTNPLDFRQNTITQEWLAEKA